MSRRPAEHERGERVINHRLVVDREQLLADRPRDRIEPGSPKPPARMIPFVMLLIVVLPEPLNARIADAPH